MAVAQGNFSSRTCNCYSVPHLTSPILESFISSRLEEHYILGEQLGWGQFGVIRVCSDKFSGEALACKSIPKDRLVTSDDVRSIRLEIEIMSRLSGHPNVVDLKAVYEDEKYVHLVMELCAGGELFHRLEKNGRFPEPKARILFRHLMEVVMYCHNNGVVHRDLKPENILLATKSSLSPIKLADFGLATYIKPGQSLYGTVGSPFYIAPEVLAGGYNQAADVWSAGVILYILLSGIPPFWGKTKSKIFDAVRASDLKFPSDPWDCISASAKDLVAGMLCRDPAHRLTAAQVLDHSWITSDTEHQLESNGQRHPPEWKPMTPDGFFSFSPLTRDFSFGSSSPADSDTAIGFPSPELSCKSSFSSFLRSATPCFPQGGFSFHNTNGSGDFDFSSPIPSLSSFAFFSPSSPKATTESSLFTRDPSFGNIFMPTDASSLEGHGVVEQNHNFMEFRAETPTRSRIHGKRNRTIGVGEREKLDLVVNESVIRWASCHLLGAASLRSSLVC